jgi:hypothetical protein
LGGGAPHGRLAIGWDGFMRHPMSATPPFHSTGNADLKPRLSPIGHCQPLVFLHNRGAPAQAAKVRRPVPGKLVVTKQAGGSRIALIGSKGKTLLVSDIFSEPRAKGATLRALRSILGEGFPVEDHTTTSRRAQAGAADGGLLVEITALKQKALRRGRSAVKSAKTAIESTVEQIANTAAEPPTTTQRTPTKTPQSTNPAQTSAAVSSKDANKRAARSKKSSKKTAETQTKAATTVPTRPKQTAKKTTTKPAGATSTTTKKAAARTTSRGGTSA